jgi:predicted ATPase
MKLYSVYLEEFKNLRQFEIDFDKDSPFTILVGQNGAGKSNLLEAIVLIFRNLDLNEKPAFVYRVVYECRGKTIAIDADPDRHGREMVRVTVDGAPIKQLDAKVHLPGHVFGYYSGPSNRLEQHFVEHQKRFYKALLDGDDRPLRRLFYARIVHSQFVLLAFYLKMDAKVQAFLRDHLRIEQLDSVLFVLHQPDWSNRHPEGDPRFWHARGTVRELLGKVYDLALAPLRIPVRVPTSFRKVTTLEHLYLYLRDQETLSSLTETYDNAPDLFKALESTYISDLLSEVRIAVRATGVDGAITFRELSEGEQQLLMVLGLVRFTREEESIFLLDEPDTHLNPRWSIEYIKLINEIAGNDPSCQLVISTHNPMVVSALTKEQVRIMRRDNTNGQVTASMPEEDPKGMGIAGILTSDLYGLRSSLDLETLTQLDRMRDLATKPGELTDDEKLNLRELREKLGGVDFASQVRDPLYSQFVEAMSEYDRQERANRPPTPITITEKDRLRRRERALQAIRELKKNREGSK